ncbi:unnamed protein product [Owenia fusiformis]|uniref:Uncharacterized protein n=1 Tax=Owenia fusiformis TaxID=6347 RepID=A0A8J1U3U8_OWEFU|nr:unnamed protein product [Owenia fusiformis]
MNVEEDFDDDTISAYTEAREKVTKNWLSPASVSLQKLDQVKPALYNVGLADPKELKATVTRTARAVIRSDIDTQPPLSNLISQKTHSAWGSNNSIPELIKLHNRKPKRPESAKQARPGRPPSGKRRRPQSAKDALSPPSAAGSEDTDLATANIGGVTGAKYESSDRPPKGSNYATGVGWVGGPDPGIKYDLSREDAGNALDDFIKGQMNGKKYDMGKLSAAYVGEDNVSPPPPPPRGSPDLMHMIGEGDQSQSTPTPIKLDFAIPTVEMFDPDELITERSVNSPRNSARTLRSSRDDQVTASTKTGFSFVQGNIKLPSTILNQPLNVESDYNQSNNNEDFDVVMFDDDEVVSQMKVKSDAVNGDFEEQENYVNSHNDHDELFNDQNKLRSSLTGSLPRPKPPLNVTFDEEKNETVNITPRNSGYKPHIRTKSAKSTDENKSKTKFEEEKTLDDISGALVIVDSEQSSSGMSYAKKTAPVAMVSVAYDDDEEEKQKSSKKKKKSKPVETAMSCLDENEQKMSEAELEILRAKAGSPTKVISTDVNKNYFEVAMDKKLEKQKDLSNGKENQKTYVTKTFQLAGEGLGLEELDRSVSALGGLVKQVEQPDRGRYKAVPVKRPISAQKRQPNTKPDEQVPQDRGRIMHVPIKRPTSAKKKVLRSSSPPPRPGSRLGHVPMAPDTAPDHTPKSPDLLQNEHDDSVDDQIIADASSGEDSERETANNRIRSKPKTYQIKNKRKPLTAGHERPTKNFTSPRGNSKPPKHVSIQQGSPKDTKTAVEVYGSAPPGVPAPSKTTSKDALRANKAVKALLEPKTFGTQAILNYQSTTPRDVIKRQMSNLQALPTPAPVYITTRKEEVEIEGPGLQECRDIRDRFFEKGLDIDMRAVKRALLPPSEQVFDTRIDGLPPQGGGSGLLSRPEVWLADEFHRLKLANKAVAQAEARWKQQCLEEQQELLGQRKTTSAKKRRPKSTSGKVGKKHTRSSSSVT